MLQRLLDRLPCSALLVIATACGGGGSGGGSGSGPATGSLQGSVLSEGSTPFASVDLHVSTESGMRLSEFDTTTSGVGRWSIDGLPTGSYHLDFMPPAGSNEPPIEYHEVLVAEGTNRFQPVFLPMVLGGALITDQDPADQLDLTFHTDPFDGGSAEPLPGLSVTVRAGTQILFEGESLEDAGIDADGNLINGRQFVLQIGLVPPEQVPMPFIDLQGRGRTGQLFFTLQPVGTTFVASGTTTPALVELTYPNVNSLAAGSSVELFRFDHDVFAWVGAGTGTVSGDRSVVVPDPGAGLPEAGWHGGPGPPPPTTEVTGQVTQSGAPFNQAGIIVVTNNGRFGVTDSMGRYSIPNVPVVGGGTPLSCVAFTDLSLAFEVESGGPVTPTFPTTVCDIEVAGTPVDSERPSVDSSDPAQGALDVPTDMPIRVTFSEVMNASSLTAAFSVSATDAGGSAPVPGTVIAREVVLVGFGGLAATEAIFVPDGSLPDDASVSLVVSTDARDLNDNRLAAAFTLAFETGTVVGGAPQIFAVSPEAGRVGDEVTIRGVNLTGSSLTLGGVSVTPDSVSANTIVFDVPDTVGDRAPGEALLELFVPLQGGTLLQSSFDLRPRITSLVPPSGAPPGFGNPGALIAVSGFNFSPDGMNDLIRFGSTAALAEAGGDATSFQVFVPFMATSGSFRVTENGRVSNSAFFTVTAPVDSIPPQFVSSSPGDGAVDIPLGSSVTLLFDELVNADSSLLASYGDPPVDFPVATSVGASANGSMGSLSFTLPLTATELLSQTLTVSAGAADVFDLAGNPAAPFSFAFTLMDEVSSDPCELLDDGKDELDAGNLAASRTLFEAALAAAAGDAAKQDEARFFLTVVDLALGFDQEGGGSAALAFHELMEGFGFPAGGPDLFALDLYQGPADLPLDSPTCADVQAYLSGSLVPHLRAVRDALAALPATFQTTVPMDSGMAGEIDHADVLAMRLSLELWLAQLNFVGAYGCDLDLDALSRVADPQPNADLLGPDPTLLVLESSARLQATRTALQSAITLYSDTVAAIQAETDDQLDDLLVLESPQDVQDAMDIELLLADVTAALNGSGMLEFGDGFVSTLDLGTPFSMLDLRMRLPMLEDGKEFPALFDPLYDATLGGIVGALLPEHLCPLTVPFDTAPTATISLVDGSVADWGALQPAAADPTGPEPFCGEVSAHAMSALDIVGLFVAEDDGLAPGPPSGSYFFRVDFDGGSPDPLTDFYAFTLQSNEQGSANPRFDGSIFYDSQLSVWDIRIEVDGVPLHDGPNCVQVGAGFLEFAFPKVAIALGGYNTGDEVVYTFEARDFNSQTFVEGFDESSAIRIVLDL